jgi:hypothetical protein
MISCVYVNSYINSELEAARGAKSESRWDDVYVHAGNILEKDSNHSEAKTLRKNAEYIKDKLSTIDLINKTCGVYTTDIAISNKGDETFKFDIGV